MEFRLGKNVVVWIEARIFVNEGKENEVLLTLIKPLIQQLKSTFSIQSYHFLFEPEILFRVLTIPDHVEKIKGMISNLQQNEHIREVKYPQTPYKGERKSFGEDGWKTTYKFLEAGSDFALDLLDQNVRKGPKFNRLGFSHYFLNQSGFHQLQEANFHAIASIERMAYFTLTQLKPLGEKITQLETRIKALEERPQST